jgi:hypothetical protein
MHDEKSHKKMKTIRSHRISWKHVEGERISDLPSGGARPSSGAATSRLSRLLELSDPILSSIRSFSSLFDLGNTPSALPPAGARPSPFVSTRTYSSTLENTHAAALRTLQRPRRARAEERGMAVVVMLILMAILMMFVASNVRTLVQLKQEIRLVERKQIHRLEADGRTHANANQTNAITQTAIAVPPESANAQAASK